MSIMRKKIFTIFILTLFGLLFLGYSYMRIGLKSFISTVSKRDLGRTVSIGRIGLGFPLSLELKDVAIEDTIEASSITIYPNVTYFLFNKKLLFSKIKIKDPVIRISGRKDSISFLESLRKDGKKGETALLELPNVYFSKIDVNNATLVYEGKRNKLEFVKIKGAVRKPGFYFSKNNVFRFGFTGFLKNKDSHFLSPLRINGKTGLDRTVNARLQLKDIMLDSLKPLYLRKFEGIKGEMVDLRSDVRLKGNNLIAKCGLKIKDAVTTKDAEEENVPFVASFILLFNLKSKILKIKNLQGDFLK